MEFALCFKLLPGLGSLALAEKKQSLPERLVYVDELPRTAVGKVHRVEVRKLVSDGVPA